MFLPPVKQDQMSNALFGACSENTLQEIKTGLSYYNLDPNTLANSSGFKTFDNIVSDRAIMEAKETMRLTSKMRLDGIYELRGDEFNRATPTMQEYIMHNPLIFDNIDRLDGYSLSYVDDYKDTEIELEYRPEYYQVANGFSTSSNIRLGIKDEGLSFRASSIDDSRRKLKDYEVESMQSNWVKIANLMAMDIDPTDEIRG